MKPYIVVCDASVQQLAIDVNRRVIEDGYVPQGGIVASPGNCFMQAMYKSPAVELALRAALTQAVVKASREDIEFAVVNALRIVYSVRFPHEECVPAKKETNIRAYLGSYADSLQKLEDTLVAQYNLPSTHTLGACITVADTVSYIVSFHGENDDGRQ